VCVCVCQSALIEPNRVEIGKNTSIKPATGIVHHEDSCLPMYLILGQKVKVTKCKNIFHLKATEWPA